MGYDGTLVLEFLGRAHQTSLTHGPGEAPDRSGGDHDSGLPGVYPGPH